MIELQFKAVVPNSAAGKTVPTFSGQDWKLRGHCTQADPEAWFPDHDGDNPIKDQTRRDEKGKAISAKDICRRCPVRNECLQYALDRKESHGIWGGLTTKERNKLRKQT